MEQREEYKCIIYNSKKECKSCDGFGRNLDNKINTKDCYKPKGNLNNKIEKTPYENSENK